MTTQELAILLKINADTKDGQSALKSISRELDALPDSTKNASGAFSKLKTSVDDFGSSTAAQLGAAGALGAITAFVSKSVTSLAEFENVMVSVQKTTGMSAPEVERLGDALREMATTQIPGTTATELGEIAAVAGQLGISGEDNILSFTESIAEMTKATGLSAEEAATGMAQIEQVFKSSLTAAGQTAAEQTANIGSAFNALENDTTAKVGALIDMTSRMGGAASTFGLAVDEVAAIAATLYDQGVNVEVAGTAMSKFFLDIVSDADSWASAMEIDAAKFSEAVKTDPAEAVQMVATAMQDLNEQKGPEALIATLDDLDVKDTRLIDAMLKLGNGADELEENMRTSNTAFEEGVSLHEEAATAASSSANQWKNIGEKANEAFRNFGEGLKPVTELLTDWASGGLDIINSTAKTWQGGLKDEFFDTVVENFNGLTEGIANFGTSTSEKLAAVGEAFNTLGEIDISWSEIVQSETLTSLFEDIIVSVAAEAGELGDTIKSGWDSATAQWDSAITDIKATTDAFWSELQAAPGNITGWFADLDLGDWTASTKTAVTGFLTDLEAQPAAIAGWFTDLDLGDWTASTKTAFNGYLEEVKGYPGQIGQWFSSVTDQIAEPFEAAFSRAESALGNYMDAAEAVGVRNDTMTGWFEKVTDKIYGVEDALEGHSLTPAMYRYIEAAEASGKSTEELGQKYQDLKAHVEYVEITAESLALSLNALRQAHEDHTAAMEAEGAEFQEIYAESMVYGLNTLRDAYQETYEEAEYPEDALLSMRSAVGVVEEVTMSYGEMAAAAVAAVDSVSGTLGDLSGSLSQLSSITGLDLGGLTDTLDQIRGYAEIPGILNDVTDSVSGLFSGLGDLGGLGSSLTGILGSGGLTGALSGLTAAAGPVALAGGAIWAAWEGIGALFEDTKSEGTEAAEAFQNFVDANISGGSEMEAALESNFDAMSQAGFDYATFLQDTGTTMDQTFGGISENWQDGATALDLFTIAVGEASGSMEKAPQIVLQMMASFEDLGYSTEEAAAKMLEIAEASGMSADQVAELEAALSAGGEEGDATTTVFDNASASAQALGEEVSTLSGDVSTLSGQLSGATDEGSSTSAIFDIAASAATNMDGTVNTLSTDVATLTGQLSGATIEGASTSAIFDTATGAATDLDSMTMMLSGDLDTLTAQLSGAGVETSVTSGLFTEASGSAQGLQVDLNALQDMAGLTSAELQSVQTMLESLPAEKQIDLLLQIATSGDIPELASGGTVRANAKDWGVVIHNELGPEIAKYPSGRMALLTAAGPTLSAFPAGTEIIPHHRVHRILQQNPHITAMASGGTVRSGAATIIEKLIIENKISGNYLAPDMDFDTLTDQISYRLEDKIRGVLRRI